MCVSLWKFREKVDKQEKEEEECFHSKWPWQRLKTNLLKKWEETCFFPSQKSLSWPHSRHEKKIKKRRQEDGCISYLQENLNKIVSNMATIVANFYEILNFENDNF